MAFVCLSDIERNPIRANIAITFAFNETSQSFHANNSVSFEFSNINMNSSDFLNFFCYTLPNYSHMTLFRKFGYQIEFSLFQNEVCEWPSGESINFTFNGFSDRHYCVIHFLGIFRSYLSFIKRMLILLRLRSTSSSFICKFFRAINSGGLHAKCNIMQ